MVELRAALDAVRTRRGATQWETTADIRAWLDASAPPPSPLPAHQPPAAAAAAAAAAADADAAAAAASGEAGERAFASAFSWDAAKRGAEADEGQEGGGGAHWQGGGELRVMERVAAKLRAELELAFKWFPLVRAAPDAAAAACSQVTGSGALGPAVHCIWGAEGNWGGAWWWVVGAGGAGALRRGDAAEPRGGAEPAEGARATRAALRWIQRSVAAP